ncbi:MAG: glycosyl transferase [Micrococcales bacterium]|nr:glycosyl transferase [Micrococcales bacterium]
MTQPHLAFIAWGFPPSRSGGAYRLLATANAFAQAGWQVTVITVDRKVFTDITMPDLSLEERIDPAIEVVRTPFPWPLRNPDRSSWSLMHKLAPRLWRKWRVVYESRIFPEVGYSDWLPTLRRALRQVNKARPVDLVLASGNPWVGFEAAAEFGQANLVPYVMDYRDAWTLDQFSGAERFPPTSRQGQIEQDLIAGAAQIWFVNSATLEWHAQRYPAAAGTMRVVANGWDPEFMPKPAPPEPPTQSKPMTFGYLGTISIMVPVTCMVEAWRQAKAEGLLPSNARLEVGGYLGYFGAARTRVEHGIAAAIKSGQDVGVEFIGPVPKGDVAAFYSRLDGLVLAIDAGRYVTTGKVFEYIATAKPIVSVHPPEAAASDVLEGYPLWAKAAELSVPAVAQAFGQAAQMAGQLTSQQTDAARDFAWQLRRAKQLAQPIEELTALVS